ncbi:hypothetical protein SPRG_14897 [Saprolegnia parasitica CBS 223.65]|uniref:Beta-adaptin appendage C-terminal subdomain domain-containing protein n=1 Tax=Saprolegnia parasitica (strain CBS 223.65) TaxID=695850 RepID=A0A067BZ69_SAPPC|nr:hypothetical protein SPRG_14897 [Saprolegnia parasitica CBS 223.65]KDO19867.1 hypothetical protein SPRG_14897 [Saprolegnia parasitica CBS 223.65]|eukprot:XP_012209424.1 hypothetical protein SPRG_14897 [Saprolegnia parasitica CBS 223.65]
MDTADAAESAPSTAPAAAPFAASESTPTAESPAIAPADESAHPFAPHAVDGPKMPPTSPRPVITPSLRTTPRSAPTPSTVAQQSTPRNVRFADDSTTPPALTPEPNQELPKVSPPKASVLGTRRASKKYAITELQGSGSDDSEEKHEDLALEDDAELPGFDPSMPKPKLKLKLTRQLTFQQRQRRQMRKHKRVLLATSHSLFAFASFWFRTLLSLHTHEWMAYLLIVFGLLGECTTPGPRYNVAIGTLLLTVPVKKIELHLTTTGMVVAILVDLFWLCRSDERSYGATFPWQLTSFCRVWAALCMLLKVWLSLSVYWYLEPKLKTTPSHRPPKPLHLKWQVFLDRARFFFPTTILPPPTQMSRAVLLRIVALLYIYCVGSVVLLFLGIIACFSFTMYPHFQVASLGIPLHYMLLTSGVATMLTLLLFLSNLHTPIWRCLSLLWRLASYTGPLVHWHGVGYTNDLNWIKMVTIAKLVDACCGLYLFLVLYASFHQGTSFFGGVTALLLIATGLNVLLQCWVPLLLLVLYKFIGVMEQTHRDFDTYHLLPRNWDAEDHAIENGSSDDSDDDDDDGTNDSSSSSSSSASSESDCFVSENEAESSHPRRRRRHARPSAPPADVWVRHHDGYDRAYVRNTITGETFWDDDAHETETASPLSCTLYMTHDDFKYFWNSLEYSGGFACRISVLPTVEALTEHLAASRFYVITDGMASETIRAVYFYAIHSATMAHFLGALLLDSLSNELEAKFKCDQPEMVPEIVQCLQLKALLGDYEQLR